MNVSDNSRRYRKANPVTSSIGLASNALGALFFLVIGFMLMVNGAPTGVWLVSIGVGVLAALAFGLLALGRHKRGAP